MERGVAHHPRTVAFVEIGDFLIVADLLEEQVADVRIVGAVPGQVHHLSGVQSGEWVGQGKAHEHAWQPV